MSTPKRAALWWQLFRVGAAAGRAASAGRARFVALACATLAVSLAISAFTLIFAAYDGREERGADRAPRFAQTASDPEAQALWKPAFDSVRNVQYSIVYIAPLRPDAPLPPGVSGWPEPGQAVLSPGLLAAGRSEGIENRFGAIASTIGEAGLASPGEWLAYVRPPAHLLAPEAMQPVTGFGSGASHGFGEEMFVQPIRLLLVLAAFMAAVPAAALSVSAARAGSDARDQRTALLAALGGGWRTRAVINMGEAAVPVAVGALIGIAVSSMALIRNTQLPVVDFTVDRADARSWGWAMMGAPLAAMALVLLCVVLMHPPQQRAQGTRPRLARTRLPRWWPYLCPMMVFLAVRGPELAPDAGTRLLIYATGVGAAMVTLPSLVGLIAAATGRGLAAAGRRTGRSGALISGRWAAAWPGATARLTAGVIIAFILVGQTQLWTTRNTGPAVQAQQTVQRVGSSVVLVTHRQETPLPQQFIEALPPGVETLRLKIETKTGAAELNGSCEALTRVALPCSTTATPVELRNIEARIAELYSWDTPGQGLSVRQTTDPQGALIVLVGTPGQQISVSDVKQAANAHLATSVTVDTIAGSWLTSATMQEHLGRWTLLFGIFAIIATAIAILVSNLAEFVRFSRQITALSVLSGNRTVYLSTSFFALFVPLLGASLIGLTAHYWLATPMTSGTYSGGSSLSWPLLALVLVATTALALVVWLWGAYGALRQTRNWRPAAD
ncbi:ABC transporter permease [Streptomyces xanthophaeus]